MRDFCNQYVKTMGVCTEGSFIELGMLTAALGCNCTVLTVQTGGDWSNLTVVQCPLVKTNENWAKSIALRYRNNRYDLLYYKRDFNSTRGIHPRV